MPSAATEQLPRIQRLPALLVNQIAAGEVVERPSSVVKELLENSIDARPTRITVDLEKGGVELIRVSDDGAGISPDDLPLALAPHATSKITTVSDLDRIATMGFRGEALASIAAVSRLSIRSRTPAAPGASRIDCAGDDISPVRPEAGPVGTSVTVRNLFFNTPARRRFLRTPATEQGHCADVVRALALSHPAIGFTLTCDERTLLELPPGQSPRERTLAILGPELGDKLLEISADDFDETSGVSLWGLAGLPEIARPTAKSQRFFVNGRTVRDQTIAHALQEAYRGLIDPGRRPMAVLMLDMDPASVDVNVHPSKSEVRFRDSSLVHSVVLRAVREALRAADLTPRWTGAAGQSTRSPEFGTGLAAAPTTVSPGEFADAFKRLSPGAPDGSRFDYDALRTAVEAERAAAAPHSPPAQPPQLSIPTPRPADRVIQVHNSYLVTQDEQGVVIIDQHALHERVMFEQLMQRLGAGALESQRLLTPAVIQTTAQRVERLADLAALLQRLGVEAEPIGPAAIAVHAFPTFLFDKHVDPAEFVGELLERAESDGFSAGDEAALHDVVDMMACKAAVKAGDHLTEQELAELIAMRDRFERSSNCPHGRPTTIRLTIRDLEKKFGRT